MKGFKDKNKKFHPITQYKRVRKARDSITVDGVKIKRKAVMAKIIGEGLKTPKEKKFAFFIQDEFSKRSIPVQNSINNIFIVKHHRGRDNQAFITKDRQLEISYKQGVTKKEYKTILTHELDHAYFIKKEKTNHEAIKKYAETIGKLPPFTLNLEIIKSEIEDDKKNNIKRSTIKGTDLDREYIDEVHSETSENLHRQRLNLPETDLKRQKVLFNKKAFNIAIKAYNQLHNS